jgi:hypothetical protein
MSQVYLEFTYRDGKPFAGYLYLPRRAGDTAERTEEAEAGLLVDFAPDGRPIGVEITSPSVTTLETINRVLKSLGLDSVTDRDLSPLTFAA